MILIFGSIERNLGIERCASANPAVLWARISMRLMPADRTRSSPHRIILPLPSSPARSLGTEDYCSSRAALPSVIPSRDWAGGGTTEKPSVRDLSAATILPPNSFVARRFAQREAAASSAPVSLILPQGNATPSITLSTTFKCSAIPVPLRSCSSTVARARHSARAGARQVSGWRNHAPAT
jgi:hypothetical protein